MNSIDVDTNNIEFAVTSPDVAIIYIGRETKCIGAATNHIKAAINHIMAHVNYRNNLSP